VRKDPVLEITSVSGLVKFVEDSCDSFHLFRGQPFDRPLLPRIARGDLRLDFLIQEQRLLREFEIRSAPYLDAKDMDAWDWLAIAQHHGLATRLLDWTANPLAALWFAVKDEPKGLEPAVLWLLPVSDEDIASQESEDPFEASRTRVFEPKHITKTIVAQGGWFTAHKHMKESNEFIPLENNKLYKRDCEKCVVPVARFERLRNQLDQFGVNASTMFPGLSGLSEYLNFAHLPQLIVRRFPR
jgi:hypothetical protein